MELSYGDSCRSHGSGRGKLALFLSKLVTCKYIKSFSTASVLFNEEVMRVKKYPANHKTTGNRDQNKDFFSLTEYKDNIYLHRTVCSCTEEQECEKWQGKRLVWWKGIVAFIVGLGSGFNLGKTPFNKFVLLR